MDKDSNKILNYQQLLQHPNYNKAWTKSSANEFGRLTNSVGSRITGTKTMCFIHKHEITKNQCKDVTYGSFTCSIRNKKDEPNRTRFTVDRDKINYPGDVATPKAEMLDAKILFNSIVSTRGAKFMILDISNFYLMTLSCTQNTSMCNSWTYP